MKHSYNISSFLNSDDNNRQQTVIAFLDATWLGAISLMKNLVNNPKNKSQYSSEDSASSEDGTQQINNKIRSGLFWDSGTFWAGEVWF